LIEIQAYQCSDIISYLLKLAWQLPSGMSFDHVMVTACARTITLLYIYLYVWGLDLRLNNVNYSCWYFSLSVNHHILILNPWNTIQPQYHNQWVSYLWYFTVKVFKHMKVWFTLFSFKMQRVYLKVYLATPGKMAVVFEFVWFIALDTS